MNWLGDKEEARQNISILQNDYRVMKNATFTSCLRGDNAWAVDASEIRQYVKEEYAEMWHARFKVHGVPVFYTPLFTITNW